MARPRSNKPKRVVRRLSDGTIWAYYYDRITGAPVGQERIDKTEPTVSPGTIAALIADYRQSTGFKSRKPRTQLTYSGTLNFIAETMGDVPIHSVTAVRIQAIKEALSERPAKANQTLALLSILFKFAMRTGKATHNPATSPGKLEVLPRTGIWSPEAERRFAAELRPSLRLAFGLMLYTLQRFSDVLAMTTEQVMDRAGRLYIVLTQQKTQTLLAVPVHTSLEPMLRERMAQRVTSDAGIECRHLVTSTEGKPWKRRPASRAWDRDIANAETKRRKELAAAGMAPEAIDDDIASHQAENRHALRRTGIVRLAERGATTPQIAAISGHEIDYCQSIIESYLPRRTEVALGGIEAWETREPSVVGLSNREFNRKTDF